MDKQEDELKALREEVERLKEEAHKRSMLATPRQFTEEHNKYLRDHIATLESQLAELHQGGEAVYMFRCKGLDDFFTCTIERYEELKQKPHLFEVRVAYTRPQPAIPPGYALVPIEPTPEMVNAGLAFTDNKLLWHISRGAAQDFYKAMLAASPSVPVAEKEDTARLNWLEEMQQPGIRWVARHLSTHPAPDDQQAKDAALRQVVGTVLEGFTLPHHVRKILEAAYWNDAALSITKQEEV